MPGAAGNLPVSIRRGVLPATELNGWVDELTSGPLVAVEVATHNGKDTVEALREVAGPNDPELARILRPNTIRAKFGANKVQSAIHVTDLPEDGELEVEYWFQLLQ